MAFDSTSYTMKDVTIASLTIRPDSAPDGTGLASSSTELPVYLSPGELLALRKLSKRENCAHITSDSKEAFDCGSIHNKVTLVIENSLPQG